jgi:hypothetical protein
MSSPAFKRQTSHFDRLASQRIPPVLAPNAYGVGRRMRQALWLFRSSKRRERMEASSEVMPNSFTEFSEGIVGSGVKACK